MAVEAHIKSKIDSPNPFCGQKLSLFGFNKSRQFYHIRAFQTLEIHLTLFKDPQRMLISLSLFTVRNIS